MTDQTEPIPFQEVDFEEVGTEQALAGMIQHAMTRAISTSILLIVRLLGYPCRSIRNRRLPG